MIPAAYNNMQIIYNGGMRSSRPSLSKKQNFDSCASCGSTHKIEFAQQIHNSRGRGPGHPLLPLCGNSPCVPRNLYKGRKNVPARRGFSSKFDRKRGFDRDSFSAPQDRTQVIRIHTPGCLSAFRAQNRQICGTRWFLLNAARFPA